MDTAFCGAAAPMKIVSSQGGVARVVAAIAALVLSTFSALVPAFDPEFDPDREPRAAGGTTITEGYDSVLKGVQTIDMLGADLFGEQTNLSNGATSFAATDVSLDTNSGLPVSVGRKLVMNALSLDEHGGTTESAKQIFGQYWELDVPYMRGTFDARVGWITWTSARCSTTNGNFFPPGANGIGSWSSIYFEANEFWSGNWINIPGQGEEELLKLAPGRIRPTDGMAYLGATRSEWRVACHPTVQNGTGEGFVVVLPNGTRYRFDWMVSRSTSSLVGYSGDGGGANTVMIPRVEVFLYATQVTDRFGNTVTYSYDPGNPHRLMSIASSDGATLTLQYDAQGKVQYIDAGSRRWEYVYSGASSTLKTLTDVILPDQSRWKYVYSNLYGGVRSDSRNLWGSCTPNVGTKRSDVAPSAGETSSVTITHPAGATGTFKFRKIIHGTNDTPSHCTFESGGYQGHPFIKIHGVPMAYQVASLYEKTITGPGISGETWNYQYVPSWTWGSTYGGCLPSGCGISSQTVVDEPGGERHRYVFGNDYQRNSGQLLELTISKPSATVLRKTENTYLQSAEGQPYPGCRAIAEAPQLDPENRGAHERSPSNGWAYCLRPLKTSTITQDGAWFRRTNNTFDLFARSTEVRRESSLGYVRTETVAYHDHTATWMLGQIANVNVGATTVVANTYDPTSAVLRTQSRFGKIERTLDWYADGTLKTSRDGLNQTTTFETFKRGIPQTIRYHNNDSESAVVDDLGQIASYTNAAGFTTTYLYDGLGRLKRITHPTGDSVAWNVTDRVFEPVAVTEYGLGPGHWRLTESTGNARAITYYDARWRPVLTRAFDAADEANTRRMVLSRYDAANRTTFVSYPQRNIASVAATPPGTAFEYDGIGRPTRSRADSELGLLETRIEYLSAFRKQVTNPRGYTTTISYQAFDEPSEANPLTISEPLGTTTTIVRDVFGKPTQMTRSGNYLGSPLSAVRRYVYDPFQRLCKMIEPETGSTIVDYDGANNVVWRAPGLSLSSTTDCQRTSVTAAQKITHVHDARNRLTDTYHGDGSPSIHTTYTADGLPWTVNSDGSLWTYTYNKRRLLESEVLAIGTATYSIGHGYTGNGYESTLSYPDGLTIDYLPNALGEPTRVRNVGAAFNYASNVTRHPNGALASFSYGNGIIHTGTQTVRGLPDLSADTRVGLTLLNDNYDWDANGNVSAITSSAGLGYSRSMQYDARDRLTRTIYDEQGPATVTFGYDSLDNLRTYVTPFRNYTHEYDGTNRLTRIRDAGNVTKFAYGYAGTAGARGVITQRNQGSGVNLQNYTVGLDNRIRALGGSASASYTYDGMGRRTVIKPNGEGERGQVYGQNGQLLYEIPCLPASRVCTERILVEVSHVYLGRHAIARVQRNIHSGVATPIYQHTDGLGSPVAETDAAGNLVANSRGLFEPYGLRLAGSTGQGPGYTGHVQDAATGLNYMQQRYYDPVAGRFLSPDPVAADPNTGANFNRYWYANNNPYRYVDPDGRNCVSATEKEDACRSLVELGGNDDAAGRGGRLNYFNKSEPAHAAAEKYVSPVPGAFVTAGHSSATRMDDNRENAGFKIVKYPEEIAKDIRAGGWKNGQPIDLVGCNAGLDPGTGGPSLAQSISNILRVTVRAPDSYTFWWADGTVKTFDRIPGNGPRGWLPNYDRPGEWKIFNPSDIE